MELRAPALDKGIFYFPLVTGPYARPCGTRVWALYVAVLATPWLVDTVAVDWYPLVMAGGACHDEVVDRLFLDAASAGGNRPVTSNSARHSRTMLLSAASGKGVSIPE